VKIVQPEERENPDGRARPTLHTLPRARHLRPGPKQGEKNTVDTVAVLRRSVDSTALLLCRVY